MPLRNVQTERMLTVCSECPHFPTASCLLSLSKEAECRTRSSACVKQDKTLLDEIPAAKSDVRPLAATVNGYLVMLVPCRPHNVVSAGDFEND